MSLPQNLRRARRWPLLSLVFCLGAAPFPLSLDAQATSAPDVRPMPHPTAAQQQDSDDTTTPAAPASTPAATSAPAVTSTPATTAPTSATGVNDTPMPTHPYVLPPTSVRPSAPAVDDSATKPEPHPIFLPPPPDETPSRTAHNARPASAAPHKAPVKPTSAPKPEVATKPAAAPAATPAKEPAPTKAAAPSPAISSPTPAAAAGTTRPMPTPAQASQPASVAETPTQSPAAEPATQAAAATPGTTSDLGSSTFGFYAGETRDQIVAAIGQTNILKQQGDILEVAAAPRPDPNFDSFLLIVGPTTGLVKLIATGKDIDDDATGRQMKLQFAALKADLSKGYGDPSDNFDFLDVKATHRAPGQFMLSLTNNERSLAAYWTKKDFGNKITSISLSGNGLGDDTGYLSIEYEFAGYHDYLAAKK